MARCIRMRKVFSAVILFSAVLKCMLVEDGQGMARKDADPLGTMATESAHFPGRVLFEDSSSQFDVAGMTQPCHHQRNIARFEETAAGFEEACDPWGLLGCQILARQVERTRCVCAQLEQPIRSQRPRLSTDSM